MSEGWSVADDADQIRLWIFGRYGDRPGYALWNRSATGPIRLAVARALMTEYGTELIVSGTVWTYARRPKRGVAEHSEHNHCVALDVNPPSNPVTLDGRVITDLDRFGLEDGAAFLEAFLTSGFRWGGTFGTDLDEAREALGSKRASGREGRVDPMHFELALDPEAIAATNWEAEIAAARP